MKKLSLALAAALLMAGTSVATAQDQPRPQGGPGRNMGAMLLQGITLTAEQQAKVDSITAKYRDQMMALRQDQSMDRDARMTKSRELMTKQSDEIKALLNDDQKKVFDKNVADMEARRAQMQGGGQRPPQA